MDEARAGEDALARVCARPGMKPLLRFAAPTMGMMLFLGLYTVCDAVFVARFAGTDALAALNIVCPVVQLTVGLGTMLAAGGGALVARRMGAGETRRAARDFTLLSAASAAAGALLAGAGAACADALLRGLGADEALLPYGRAYLLPLLFFTPASLLQVLFAAFFVTAGRPGLGMLLGAGAGIVNLLLDFVFMGPLEMGVRGAALATGLGYTVPAAGGVWFFAARKTGLRFCAPPADGRVLAQSCANGLSEMIGQSASAVTTFLFNRVMLRLLGGDGVAAVTILLGAQFLLHTLYIGFSMGVAPVVSYLHGKRDGARLRRVFSVCLRVLLAASAAVFALAAGFGSPLARVFAPPDAPVYAIARHGFSIFAWSFLFSGWNIFASAALTALSDGRASALLSSLRSLVLLPLLLLVLPPRLGAAGVWLAVPAAELGALLAAMALAYRRGGRVWAWGTERAARDE